MKKTTNLGQNIKSLFDDNIEISDQIKYAYILRMILIIHFFICLIFLYFKVYPIFFYNIFAVLLYACIEKFILPLSLYKVLYILSSTEVLVFSSFATLLIGWDFGYMLYTIALVPVSFYLFFTLEKMKNQLFYPLFSSLTTMVFFIIIRLASTHFPPLHKADIPASITLFIFCANVAVVFVMLIVFSLLFIVEIKRSHALLVAQNARLQQVANLDPLTQLINRRSMEYHLQQAETLALAEKSTYTIIIGDIDNFKLINDTFGHVIGDEVLKQLSQLFDLQVGSCCHVCRWGGEEFLFLLPTSSAHAHSLAEKLRHEIANTNFSCVNESFHITMTFGIASYTKGATYQSIIQIADQHLYEGKKAGKNQSISS